MKRILLLLLAVALCAGCASRYNITLSNGQMITAKGKPKYDREKNGYNFKDGNGQPDFISAMRVREIAPESMSKPSGGSFFINGK